MSGSKLDRGLWAALGAAVGAAAGAAATIITGSFGYLNKDRELDIRMVDVALTILSGEKIDDNSIYARRFAIEALSKYSGVELENAEKARWAEEGTLPKGDFIVEDRPTRSRSLRWPAPHRFDPKVFSDEEHAIALARVVCGESVRGNEELQQAIASVVLNRAKYYKKTIGEVVYQRGVFASMGAENASPYHQILPGEDEEFDRCYEIGKKYYSGELKDITKGALDFYYEPALLRALGDGKVSSVTMNSFLGMKVKMRSGGFVFGVLPGRLVGDVK